MDKKPKQNKQTATEWNKKNVIHFVKKIEEAVPPDNFVNGKGRAENAYALPTAKYLKVPCQASCIEELQSLEENPSEGLTLKQGKTP